MKNAIIAAVVAALVSSGGTYAATSIGGRQIRDHSIPEWKLTPRAITNLRGQQGSIGPVGPAGPQGNVGAQGPQGASPSLPRFGVGYLCVASDNSVSWGGERLPGVLSHDPPPPNCPVGDLVDAVVVPDLLPG